MPVASPAAQPRAAGVAQQKLYQTETGLLRRMVAPKISSVMPKAMMHRCHNGVPAGMRWLRAALMRMYRALTMRVMTNMAT